MTRLVCAAVLLVVSTTVATAQAPTGTIAGTVLDQQNAVLPGATITVKNTATGLTRTAASSAEGAFQVPSLPAGSYEVRVELSGFQSTLTPAQVVTGQTTSLRVSLQIGARTEAITVAGATPLIQLQSNAVQGVVGRAQIDTLPLNGRSFLNLAALQPGVSENELWAELHRGNIARGGEWIETRLLSSGPRTNPWFQECSSRVIEAGDLVAFDTDLIGPYGFCADLSRTFLCGNGRPTNEQRDLYRTAAEQIAENTELMQRGTTFRDLVERSKNPPPDCFPARYGVLYHGVGLADEYPTLPHAADWTADTPDGVLQPGMVLCVESYIGRLGGHEGVKIEEQILITETGNEKLSRYPLDARLLSD